MEVILYVALSFGLGFTLGGLSLVIPVKKLQKEVDADMFWLKDQLEWLGEQLEWLKNERDKLFELAEQVEELNCERHQEE